MKISPIINAEEFADLNPENIVIVDAGSGDSAYENYLSQHLKGAIYVDLNKDLAEIPADPKNGGRHPLPTLEKFAETVQKLGIEQNSHVIIYDDKNGSNAAARFWWMLKAVGIENVQVLNGGLQMAKENNLEITSDISIPKITKKLYFEEWKLPQIDLKTLSKNLENSQILVIDVREKDRFNGNKEPIDLIAGHIPGAINIPFSENLNTDGTFKKPEQLHQKYASLFKNLASEKIAIHCGSGVTACHTLLALDYAGFQITNLYVGSWSEWSRNDKQIATNL